jgi:SAM-dependent methyltransferase
VNLIRKNPDATKKLVDLLRYDYRYWSRPVMYEHCFRLIRDLNPESLDTLEISAGQYFKQTLSFRTYTEANYPEFDICQHVLHQKFDLIIADQAFEHLLWPNQAAKNVYEMLQPGGHFLVTTPFLVKVHPIPYDCTRWTETGLRYLLHGAGFPLDEIKTNSWGNRACVKANFKKWAREGWFGSIKNEPEFSVCVGQ